MTDRCAILGCPRPSTSRVPVWWRILTNEILSRAAVEHGGRATAVASVCPAHEQELAEGARLPVSPRAVLR